MTSAITAFASNSKEDRKKHLNESLRRFLLSGERRDLKADSEVTGGALVAEEFAENYVQALHNFAPITDWVTLKRSNNGSPTKFPVVDTAGGAILAAEGGANYVETDPNVYSNTVTDTDILSGGLVKISIQLLNDSDFSFEKDVLPVIAHARLSRGIESAVLLGKDSAGTTLPNNVGVLNWITAGTTTAALADGIGYTDIVNVYDSVDSAYLATSGWFMSSKVRNYLLSVKDSTGRALVAPDPRSGFDAILGRPIVLCDNSLVNNVTTALSFPVLFGSLQHAVGVKLSATPTLAVLTERFADTFEKGFVLSGRVASTSLVQSAVAGLKLAAV